MYTLQQGRGAHRGFTLIELLIVIAVIGILLSVSLESFTAYAIRTGRDAAARTVLGALEEAHARTLASDADTVYGVHLDTNTVTIFIGPTYVSTDPLNDVRPLPARTSILASALTGSATDISFARLTGAPSVTGTITVAQNADTTLTRTITVHSSGLIEASE